MHGHGERLRMHVVVVVVVVVVAGGGIGVVGSHDQTSFSKEVTNLLHPHSMPLVAGRRHFLQLT